MRVEAREIEVAGDKKRRDSDGFEARFTTRFALGSLIQAVGGLDEAVDLAGLSSGDDAVEVPANQTRDVLHLLDLRAHDVGAPLLQHLGDDMDLLALENPAKLLAIQPCAGGALGRALPNKSPVVGQLRQIQFVGVLEQQPAHPFEFRVGFLLLAAHRIECLGRVGDGVKPVERQPRIGQMLFHVLDEGRRHVDAHKGDLLWRTVVLAQICREAFNRLGVTPGGDERDPARLYVGDQRQILVAASARGFVNGYRAHIQQVRRREREFHIRRTDGMHPVPRQIYDACHGGKRHSLRQHQRQHFEQQGEAVELADRIRLRQLYRAVQQARATHALPDSTRAGRSSGGAPA